MYVQPISQLENIFIISQKEMLSHPFLLPSPNTKYWLSYFTTLLIPCIGHFIWTILYNMWTSVASITYHNIFKDHSSCSKYLTSFLLIACKQWSMRQEYGRFDSRLSKFGVVTCRLELPVGSGHAGTLSVIVSGHGLLPFSVCLSALPQWLRPG